LSWSAIAHESLTLLASPWSAMHRNPDRVKAAASGTFDGATSSYGGTFAMSAQHQHPTAFAAPVIGLAIASAAGMGGGEAESGDRTDLARRAVVMAIASVFGVIVVALLFFNVRGTAALVASLVLALGPGT
jgi:hypothetical protein